MPELPTCICVRGLPPYDRLTAIYQAVAELSGSPELPDSLCVAGVPPFQRFSYIYEAFRVFAGEDSLPSRVCVAGESPQDQVSRIYQAVALYADDAALLSYTCVRGLPFWQQWVEIYKALYSIVGSSDLTSPLCVNTTFDILSEVFCAVAAIDGGGGATLLASFYIPEIVDTFERSVEAGYTGQPDPDTFQREAEIDVLRDAHYQGGNGPFVILEDDPTPCVLVAPGVPSVTPGAGMFSATFAAIPVTVSLLRYEYRLDSAGPWIPNGTSTTITDAPASSGIHVLNVRAVCTSGIAGDEADSAPFEVEAGTISFLDSASAPGSDVNPSTTGAIDTSGGNLIVLAIYYLDGAAFLAVSDSKGNTYTPLTAYGTSLKAKLYYCANPTVGAGHTFTVSGLGRYSGIAATVFAGANSVPFDAESGAAAPQPGAIVPSENGQLFVVGWGRNDNTLLTINSGFTIAEQTVYTPGLALELGIAYKIQVSAASENPTTNSDDGTAMATFLRA